MRLHELNQLGTPEVSHEVMGNELNWTKIDSDFFPELIVHFEWIREYVKPNDIYREPRVAKGFNKIIRKHTGINAILSDEYDQFATIPPDINKNNILARPEVRKYYDNGDFRTANGKLKAMVDLKNYRVSGDFSKIPVKLFISPMFIYHRDLGMTNENLAAAVLHEVGHMFTFFVASVYTFTTVMPMLGMANRIMKTNTTEELVYILEKWNDEPTTLTKVDVKELADKKKETIVTAIVSNHVRDSKSIAKHNEYDYINSEYLADKFAARFGGGAHVVSMLDKVYTYVGARSKSTLTGFIFIEILLAAFAAVYVLPSIIAGEILCSILAGVGFIFLLNTMGVSNVSDGTYDTEVNRYKRIREDLISMLKDKKIDRAIGDRIRLDIKRIDNILKTYNDYKSVFGYVMDFIIPSRRRINVQSEFYRQLESLGNNDLFIQAYDLRNL
nr:MAG TPA: peptidase [Caudoviricetes sp.]